MNSKPELSAGSLEKILKEKRQSTSSVEEKPLVQIIVSRKLTSGSIRCILFDGINTTKQAILKQSPQMDVYYQSQQLDKFSVIRLEEYWVSTMNENDIQIIIISNITPIMRGSQINQKLEVFPSLNEPMDTSFGPSMFGNIASDMTINTSFNTSFNPNYKPRNETIRQSSIAPIDRSKLCSISDIHPFFNSFVIRVRIASKTSIKTYSGKDGKPGKVFSFDATDESSEIRITAFNNECDKYYDSIEKDLVYYIFKGNVKTANKKFSNLKSDYEITLISDSIIELCDEEIPLPSIQYKFIPIGQLVAQNKSNTVDVIGVITTVEPITEIVSKKDQKEYQKRDILLADKTLHEVRLTLWNEEALKFNGKAGQVLAIKSALVNDFRGKTIGCAQNSAIELDPDLPDAHLLKGWYDRESTAGRLKDLVPLSKEKQISQMKYLSQINQQSIPEGSSLYYNCKITIMTIGRWDRQLYKSCTKKACMKKVKEDNGFYYCEKCGNNSTEFEWRLMLSLCCADATGDLWVTAFHEVAEKMIGKSVDQLSQMFESDPNQFQSFMSGIQLKSFILRIGSKVEEYNNEKRIKSTCFGCTPIDPIERSKRLIQSLKSWNK